MKKVMLSAAALMIGGFAFAQTPQASTQTPLPGSALGANAGLSIQEGNGHKVQVRQSGTDQSVYTYQDDGDTGVGGNLARIIQTGNVDPGTSGVANRADAEQSGSANESTTRQEGDRNSAVTRQGGTDKMSAENRAWIRQGTGDQAEDNVAAIVQDGFSNEARIKQTYDNNDAFTTQNGDDNTSLVLQDGGPDSSGGHGAIVNQQGDENWSYVSQEGDGSNFAWASQVGDNNKAQQIQTTDAIDPALGNDARVDQGDGAVWYNTTPNMWNLDGVVGDVNPGSFNGPSFDAKAFQTQSGHENRAFIGQHGPASEEGSNYAEQNQSGSGNDAMVIQNAYGNPNGTGNYSRQDQTGTNSNAIAAQLGNSHKLWTTQTDDDNQILSVQRGLGNVIRADQSGDGSRAELSQRGQMNAILLVQQDGQSYDVNQNLLDGMPNGGNQVDILQMNGGNLFDGSLDNLIDCDFEDMMDCETINPLPALVIDPICNDC